MGHRRDWDMNAIRHGIWAMRAEMNSAYNDGFVTWGVKQELYRLKWLVDASLASASRYAGEEEWLNEEEQKKVWSILKNEM